jgi:serine/threonine protein phosphatase PrpC
VADARATAGAVLRAAARTHPGRVRPTNEDVPVVDATRGVFGVIDGIGGHAGGEVAAALAKDVALQRLARPLGTPAERVREAIAIANNTIFRRASDCPELAGMACVVTLAIIAEGRLTIGHVGDTRLYKLRAGGIRKVTRDHSPVGEREDAGELSEADAMRHPHRNEVFRDVGSVYRDKDEQEFVDVIDEPIESDAAILICSDGLSDMLPGASLAHIVRQHAGDPEQVVEALVAAANDAGGRDNITVVYAEMPRFAEAMARGADQWLTPTEPPDGGTSRITPYQAAPFQSDPSRADPNRLDPNRLDPNRLDPNRPDPNRPDPYQPSRLDPYQADGSQGAATHGAIQTRSAIQAHSAIQTNPQGNPDQTNGPGQTSRRRAAADRNNAAAAQVAALEPAARVGWIRRAARAIVSSRTTWFTAGALGGVLGAVALTAYVASTQVHGSQTLVVAADGVSPFASITAALAAARPGDVVRVEPGTYREHVQVRDGVDLVARVPGTVTIVAPATDATPALSITGWLNVRVAGVRIESEKAIDTAVHVTAPAATLELVEITGPMRHAIALSPASSVTVRGSRIAVTDTVIAVPDDGHATFVDSILTRSAASTEPAVSMSASAHVVLRGNVFAGFGSRILDGVGAAQRADMLAGNIVVAGDDHAAANAAAASGAGAGVAAGERASAPARAPAARRRGAAAQPVPEGGR